MKPIILKIWMIVATLLSFMQAFAYDFEADGKYYNIISTSDLTCEITAGDTKYSGNIDIPSTVEYEGKKLAVERIGYKAFNECEGLISVSIPNSVSEIGDYAFYNCINLEKVNVPQSLTTIGSFAFQKCCKIQRLSFPNTLQTVGERAFDECIGLISVTLPSYLARIGKRAFQNCSGLTEIELPETMDWYGLQEYAFFGCSSLKSVIFPKNIGYVPKGAFYDCSSLESVKLPEDIQSIWGSAFRRCRSLKSINLPESLQEILGSAFGGCSALESICIPGRVEYIWEFAFNGCTNLRTLEFASSNEDIILYRNNKSGGPFSGVGVENIIAGRDYRISAEGFLNSSYGIDDTGIDKVKNITFLDGFSMKRWPISYWQETLISISIGKNVTGYPSDFTKYTKLETFSINEAVPPTCPKFSSSQYEKITLYVPAGSRSAYRNATRWKNFWNIKEMGTSGIDDIEADTEKVEVGRYDILGRRVDESHRGFVIIRYSDGSSAKVINR